MSDEPYWETNARSRKLARERDARDIAARNRMIREHIREAGLAMPVVAGASDAVEDAWDTLVRVYTDGSWPQK